MPERYILEVASPPPRVSLYDYQSRELLDEISGSDWTTLIGRLAALGGDELEPADSIESHETKVLEDLGTNTGEPEDSPAERLEGSAPVETGESATPRKGGRRKLWEIPHKYHCPIIGTCLTVSELRRVGARFAWQGKERPSEYEIHVGFVATAAERSVLSQATHKLLEKKYAGVVKRFARARSAEDLLAFWQDALASGQVPGALWAMMTHAKADDAAMALVYEDIHMLSHQIGAGLRADLKALSETRQELGCLRRDFDALQRRTRAQSEAREREIQDLKMRLRQREDECGQLRTRGQALSDRLATSGIDAYQREQDRLSAELAAAQKAHAASELRATGWQEKYNQVQADRERLALILQERTAACDALERLFHQATRSPCEDCPNEACEQRTDLAGRLVLCVGGRRQLVEQYRRLVTGCNGRFNHHDGGLEDSQQRLEAMLASADAVVCATDSVSHTAYYRTKRFCKRFEKPHVLLGNSGVSAFARALEQVAG